MVASEQPEPTLLEQSWKEGRTKKVPIAKKCKDLDEVVRKAIRDSVRWATHAELYETVVNGQTLVQKLRADKEKWLDGDRSIKFGSTYYLDLKKTYQSPSRIESNLDLKGEEVDDNLMVAIGKAVQKPCNRQPLLQYVTSMTTCSRANLIAISMLMLQLSPTASKAQLSLLVECLRGLTRCSALKNHEDVAATMFDHYDETLHA
eukprot:6464054-Amphidinium_carterae.1